jgi:hypothetical protein
MHLAFGVFFNQALLISVKNCLLCLVNIYLMTKQSIRLLGISALKRRMLHIENRSILIPWGCSNSCLAITTKDDGVGDF